MAAIQKRNQRWSQPLQSTQSRQGFPTVLSFHRSRMWRFFACVVVLSTFENACASGWVLWREGRQQGQMSTASSQKAEPGNKVSVDLLSVFGDRPCSYQSKWEMGSIMKLLRHPWSPRMTGRCLHFSVDNKSPYLRVGVAGRKVREHTHVETNRNSGCFILETTLRTPEVLVRDTWRFIFMTSQPRELFIGQLLRQSHNSPQTMGLSMFSSLETKILIFYYVYGCGNECKSPWSARVRPCEFRDLPATPLTPIPLCAWSLRDSPSSTSQRCHLVDSALHVAENIILYQIKNKNVIFPIIDIVPVASQSEEVCIITSFRWTANPY